MNEIKFDPYILKYYFDLKVVQACRSCKRYGSGCCPSNIPDMDSYKKLLPAYKNGIIVYELFNTDGNWVENGKESSLIIHNYLLNKQKELFNIGNYYSIILGGGSCKMCPICLTPCRNPSMSIIPIEGCGIDVVKLMKNFNIDIKFPVTNETSYYRIGMILWT